jgi:uncharacterized lipoprotein YmbA
MFRILLIIGLILGLAACGSSPKTNFYVLNAEHVSGSFSAQKAEGIGVGVWLVELPALLNRPEIVTRSGQYKIDLADFHQWAGGLGNNMSRLIAGELGRRLKTDRVFISPWSSYRKNDYQVKIHINRFDGELGGEMVLSGAWSLWSAEGSKELTREAFTYKTQASGKNYSDMVAALSQLTVQLSEQIANVISSQKVK